MSGIKYSYMNHRASSGLTGVELVFGAGDADSAVFRFLGPAAAAMEPFSIDQAVEKWINWGNADDTNYNLWSAIQSVTWALDREGQSDRAFSHLLRMLPYSPHYEAQYAICMEISGYLKKLRRYNDAVACFGKCLEKRPMDPKMQYALHNNMGFCLCMINQSVEAEQWCREAIKLSPDEYHAHKNLGAALLGQLRIPEAAESLLQMLEVSRGDAGAVKAAEGFLSTIPQLAAEAPEVVGKIKDFISKAASDAQGVKAGETAGAT